MTSPENMTSQPNVLHDREWYPRTADLAETGSLLPRAVRAYSFVFSMMYCSTDVVKKSWKYSIGLALRESPMFTPGVAENVKEVGGRGCASIVL